MSMNIISEPTGDQQYELVPYKVYTFSMTQGGTNPPTLTVIKNTLGITPVPIYNSVGYFSLSDNETSGVFTEGKTIILTGNNNGGVLVSVWWNGVSQIDIESVWIGDNTRYNNQIASPTFVEIRVYP